MPNVIEIQQFVRIAGSGEHIPYTDTFHRYRHSLAKCLGDRASESTDDIVVLDSHHGAGLACHLGDGVGVQRFDSVHFHDGGSNG